MVGLLLTSTTEVLLASIASHAEFGKVNTSLWAHQLPLVVFSVEVNLAFLNFHHVAAWAPYKVLVLLHELFHLHFIDFLYLLSCQIRLQFALVDFLVTSWTVQFSVLQKRLLCTSLEAVEMDDVEAVCTLDNCGLFILLDTSHAETTYLAWLSPQVDLFHYFLLLF